MTARVEKYGRPEQSRWSVVGALATVAMLCASQLSSRSTWGDEICSVYAVTLPGLAESWKYIIRDVHPPLYFLLLKFWVTIFGGSIEAARALSIVFIVSGLAVISLTVRRFFTARAGLWAVILYGLTPFLIYHSVHARMYGLLFLLAAIFIRAGLAARDTGRPRDYALFALVGAGLLYTQYVGVFLVVGALLASIILSFRRQKELLAWVMSGAVIAILFAPWFTVFMHQQPAAVHSEGAARFLFRPHHLKYFAKISSLFDHATWAPLVVIGGIVVTVLILSGAWQAARRESSSRDSGRWLVATTATAIGLFIAAAAVKPLVVTRTMIWFLPSFAILAGVGLAALPAAGRAAAGVALASAWLLILPDLNLYRRHTDWRSATDFIARELASADVLVLDRSITFCEIQALDYYFDRAAAGRMVMGRNLFHPGPGEPQVPVLPPDPLRRWFFLEPSEHPSPGLHQALQDAGFVMEERQTWFEVGLTRCDSSERTLHRDPDGALSMGGMP